MNVMQYMPLIICLVAGNAVAQQSATVQFGYDNAGNRIARFEYRNSTAQEEENIARYEERIEDLPWSEITDGQKIDRFKVFPNPATTHFQISTEDAGTHRWFYALFDAKGTVHYHGELTTLPYELSFSELPPGTYYLSLRAAEEFQSFTIVKF
jgi:hypothetical protein